VGRPRKDGAPSATERMESVFFEQLRTTPFQRITVSTIVEAAEVNRNSFYYHYADLEDLAHSAVSNLLIPDLARLVAGGFGLDSGPVGKVLEDAALDNRFRRLLTVAGPNSTAELRGILKDAVMSLWLDTFEIGPGDLSSSDRATIHYALGGILELVSTIDAQDDLLAVIGEMRMLPILQSGARIAMETLNAAAARVHRG